VWGEYAGPDLLIVPGEQGNSDAHSDRQVIGLPHNVVRADDLTTDAIMEGIRSGHSWIAESASVELAFTATGHGGQAGVGETLKAPADAPVDVRLDVRGACPTARSASSPTRVRCTRSRWTPPAPER
jgi:hypothetical protein